MKSMRAAVSFLSFSLLLTLGSSIATAEWQAIAVPGFWEKQHGGALEGDFDGYAWYRCFYKVPAEWKGHELTLTLGAIDDCDQTYFNGELVGAMGSVKPYRTASSALRQYKIATKHVKSGQWNLIAVRVFDGGGGGGIFTGPQTIGCDLGSVKLAGRWHFRTDDKPSFAKAPADLDEVATAFIKQAGAQFGEKIDFSPLPGTKPLTWASNDFSPRMRAGIHRFLDRKTAESTDRRPEFWQRDLSSPEAYEKSIAENRARFERYIGAVDPRRTDAWSMQGVGQDQPREVARTAKYTISEVQWPVLEPIKDRSKGAMIRQNWPALAGPTEVFSEGLLLQPRSGKPSGIVIVIGDADHTPEQLAGLTEGVPLESQIARRLAENGFTVIVPTLLSRSNQFSKAASGNERTHRGWIYTPAFELGRHTIGYEVQKVRAAIDWAKRQEGSHQIAVAGYGEGGLLAMYSAAVDTRIDATLVSGYFGPREEVWTEPLYRNVWALLREFGDAEIATLIAPRTLVVEYSRGPEFSRHTTNTGPGKLTTPPLAEVQREFNRIQSLTKKGLGERLLIKGEGVEPVAFGSQAALQSLAKSIGSKANLSFSDDVPKDVREGFEPSQRQQRLVKQLENHTMLLLRGSEYARDETIEKPLPAKLSEYKAPAAKLRKQLRYEHIGWLDEPLLKDLNVRTRKIYEAPTWTGYHVAIDVWPDVFAWGILCLPNNIKPNERRPVVVCQHGLEGLPQDTIERNVSGYQYYKSFAARLAEQGYVTFAPHNLYRGSTEFRLMQRKLNPLKASLYSVITPQHSQIINWLETLPYVDKDRIGFYGLSYGGKTAMRVPALEQRYALSICSADYNEWVRVNADVHYGRSYMYRGPEWEMVEWDLGHSFNYAEMSYVIAPRPFMVERGHHDGVGSDEWVAYEFARSKKLYEKLNIGDRCVIEYFDGPHTINLIGTSAFLNEHLQWPKAKPVAP